MSAYDVGRVCVKLRGREAGQKCVIVDAIDRNYVVVSGPGVKRRRANMSHLEPLEVVVGIRKGAGDEEVAAALKKAT